jgi:hypothetical protein
MQWALEDRTHLVLILLRHILPLERRVMQWALEDMTHLVLIRQQDILPLERRVWQQAMEDMTHLVLTPRQDIPPMEGTVMHQALEDMVLNPLLPMEQQLGIHHLSHISRVMELLMLIHLWLPMALLAPMSFMLFIQLVILKHHMQVVPSLILQVQHE